MTFARHQESGSGPTIGILMLETRFPRFAGDVGNAETWPFRTRMRVVQGASAERVVRRRAEALLPSFIAAACELAEQGCDGITTSCGFLVLLQRELQAACPIPVATSSLLQVRCVQHLLPADRQVGIITYSAKDLSAEHLRCAGITGEIPIEGLDPESELARAIAEDRIWFDQEAAEASAVAAAERLVRRHPDVGAIVFECANLPPYATAVSRAVRRPVYDIVSFLTWFAMGLAPRAFARAPRQ